MYSQFVYGHSTEKPSRLLPSFFQAVAHDHFENRKAWIENMDHACPCYTNELVMTLRMPFMNGLRRNAGAPYAVERTYPVTCNASVTISPRSLATP